MVGGVSSKPFSFFAFFPALFFFIVTRLWPVHTPPFRLFRAAVTLPKKEAKWHGVRACGFGVCVGGFVLSPDFLSSVRAFRFRFLVSWGASLVGEVTARVTTFCLLIFSFASRFLGNLVLGAGCGGEGWGHEGRVASLLD